MMSYEVLVRVGFFTFGLLMFSVLEIFLEYRPRRQKRLSRWPANISMIFVGSLLVKVVMPAGLVVVAGYAQSNNFGLLNLVSLPGIASIFISITLLDLLIYTQHILSHKINFLWKFHRVHHADVDLDATSALRFHPVEILLSTVYKAFFVLLFGFSYQAIIIFEVLLNFMAMFNHANIRLPKKLEKIMRLLFVTPQMHIIHHSVLQKESDTNYGFNFSIWDRVFKTYTPRFKSKGEIGQEYYQSDREHKLLPLLVLPFKKVD